MSEITQPEGDAAVKRIEQRGLYFEEFELIITSMRKGLRKYKSKRL